MLDQGRPSAVADHLVRILPTWRQTLGEAHPYIVEAEGVLGLALIEDGRPADGGPLVIASYEAARSDGSSRFLDGPRARVARLLEGIADGELAQTARAALAQQ